MSVVRSALNRALHAARVVLHDPAVDRTGKQLAGLVVVRALLALGASDALVQLAQQALHLVGA